MKHLTKKNIIIASLLIAFGIAGRMALLAYPNIETLTAVSVLAGALLGPTLGFVAALFSVIGSDMMIGNTSILVYTWSAWAIIGASSTLLKRNKTQLAVWPETFRYLLGGVASTLFFYVWTNFGVWHIGGLYPHTVVDLIQSYINGLPFLRNQLLGNIVIVPATSLVVLCAWKYAPSVVRASPLVAKMVRAGRMRWKIIISSIFLFAVTGLAPRPAAAIDFSIERAATWQTFKTYYIEAYASYPAYGLVFDPSVSDSSQPDQWDDAVSEGVGYGLLLAVVMDDQTTFDQIFQAAQTWMWNGQTYDWKISTSGDKWGTGGASDADEDIAMALILADHKQTNGSWSANTAYGKQAQTLINNIYDTMVTNSGILKPGDQFGGADELNLSYFAPAWYRVFDQYERKPHHWHRVIRKQYQILLQTAQAHHGLIPDWSTADGSVAANRSGNYKMTYDAIRVPWRIAIDATWNHDKKARQYLDMVVPYILDISGGASGVKMYELDGTIIEWHNELAVAMWAAGARGTSPDSSGRKALAQELKAMYRSDKRAFGTYDLAYTYYFNQSLAMLGSALIDGSFTRNQLAH